MYGVSLSGGAPGQTNGVDFAVNGKAFPKFILNPNVASESAGQWHELGEINGSFWLAKNADYSSGGVWSLINPTLPAYALVLGTTGVLTLYSAPASVSPIASWTAYWASSDIGTSFLLASAASASANISGSGLQAFTKSYTLAPGLMNVVGNILRIRALLSWSNQSGTSGTMQLGISINGTLAVQSPLAQEVNGTGPTSTGTAAIKQDFVCSVAGTQNLLLGDGLYTVSTASGGGAAVAPSTTQTQAAFPLAGSLILVPNITFGGAGAGSSFTATMYGFSVELLTPVSVL